MKRIWLGAASLLLAACGDDGAANKATNASDQIVIGDPPVGIATAATKSQNESVSERLPIADQSDFEDARRGFIAKIEADAIRDDAGKPVWPIAQFDFLQTEAPDTVNPSLWRQSQLAAMHGLFEVTEGVWQVRGYDLSVMSVIQGETGWIIIDPLTSSETAKAALDLVNTSLGERPVTAVLYTHSHADHFGGVRGVTTQEDVDAGRTQIIAPAGFVEHAVSENLIAGNLMGRRAVLMFGRSLPKSAIAHVGSGLGPGLPDGTIGLILPTEEIGPERTQKRIDGVLFEFTDAGGTEAPAEFMFYLPEKRALCTSEVATGTFHNILTPRGAKVRDSLAWSRVIEDVLEKYGDKSDVVFASHHWPTWGTDNVKKYLRNQRDVYRYVHDQTMRLANSGATMEEAAEAIEEPPFMTGNFDTRGYYGTLKHNAKAVYQGYFGWWSGVPANYNALPEVEKAPRYVAAMGGADATLKIGADAFGAGEYRWAAEVLNHLVFAEPDNDRARKWLAASYEQLGFQAESGAWRSYYLTAAQELRHGLPAEGGSIGANSDFLSAVPSLKLFDSMAVRFNPTLNKMGEHDIQFVFTDRNEVFTLEIGSASLTPRTIASDTPAVSVTTTRGAFDKLILQEATFPQLVQAGEITVEGNQLALLNMFQSLETPPFWLNVVEP